MPYTLTATGTKTYSSALLYTSIDSGYVYEGITTGASSADASLWTTAENFKANVTDIALTATEFIKPAYLAGNYAAANVDTTANYIVYTVYKEFTLPL
jgi:hypothetical protein